MVLSCIKHIDDASVQWGVCVVWLYIKVCMVTIVSIGIYICDNRIMSIGLVCIDRTELAFHNTVLLNQLITCVSSNASKISACIFFGYVVCVYMRL